MDLARLEVQRQALEINLQQLRKGLKHWQTLDAEYEGLKEEIQVQVPESGDANLLEKVAKTYGGDLVDEQEVRILFGLDKNAARSRKQIVDVIERRQEYVGKNLEVIKKRFFEAEAKLEEFDFQAVRSREGSGEYGEGDLPLTEIVEELDEEDNVLSSRLERPEASHVQLLESLRKAGVTDGDIDDANDADAPPPLKPAITNASPPMPGLHVGKSTSPERQGTTSDHDMREEGPSRPPIRKKSVSFSADTKAAPEFVRLDSEDGKKSVTFAEKVAVAPAAPLPDPRSVSFSPNVEEIPEEPIAVASPPILMIQDAHPIGAKNHTGIEKDLKGTFKPGDKVLELDENDEIKSQHVVLPDNDTPEDAQARREMLDYHLNEVGHVVAEIDLIEGESDGYSDDNDDDDDDDTSSHYTGSTYLGDEDTPYTSGMSDNDEDPNDDEDKYGRSRRSVITDDYREEMQALQRKLIGNLGAVPKDEEVQDADPDLDPQDVRKLVIRNKRGSMSSIGSDDGSERKATNSKKRVSFAEDVDVAEPGPPPLKTQKHMDGENIGPMSNAVTEHAASGKASLGTPAELVKPSRFKKSRAIPTAHDLAPSMHDTIEPTPSFIPGQTLANNLIERPASNNSAPSTDDPDPIMQRRELAAAYYQRRNEMIKQQGGFKRDEEEEELLGPLMEEKDGKVKKVSRFMAARIRGPE